MKKGLFSGRSTRTKIFTVVTCLAIVLLIALNLFMNYFVVYDTAYIDMTPEGLYTLRDVMVEECAPIFRNEDGTLKEQGIKVTFCADPDTIIGSTLMRAIYYTAIGMSKEFPNFEVECVNVALDPMAVAQYKTTSLTEIAPSDVIVSYGSRYRIVSGESFWRISGGQLYSYDGEYKLASIMMSLTLVDQPKAYFVKGHGEAWYDPENPESEGSVRSAYLYDLLRERGFEVSSVNLSELIKEADEKNAADPSAGAVPKLPDDCVLLIINDPRTDFVADPERFDEFSYISETEIMNRFMTEGRGSIAVARDYETDAPMPNLDAFLADWGMKVSDTLVKDNVGALDGEIDEAAQGTTFIAEYNSDENSYAYSIYEAFANLGTSPRAFASNTGHIICSFGDSTGTNESGTGDVSKIFAPFLYTTETAIAYAKHSSGDYIVKATEAGQKTLAAICGRQALNSETGDYTYSYLFCAASGDFFGNDLLGNPSYSNYDIVSAAFQSMARLDTYASMKLGGVSVNNYANFAGKVLVSTTMTETDDNVLVWREDGTSYIGKTNYALLPGAKIAYTVAIAVVPLVIAVIGIVVCVKRKFL